LTFVVAALLLVFTGSSAFAAPDGPAGVPAVTRPIDDSYLIHGGDQLEVIVYGEKDLTQNVTVLPDGMISFPLISEVHIGGQTPTQAAETLATSLKHFVRAPQVSVVVVKEGPLEVLVLGDVLHPGKYELPSRSRLTDAIASAGGLGPTEGDFPDARIANAQGNVEQVSLQKLLHDGDVTQNAPLADEMTVYVPSPVTFNIHVLGAVAKPGDVTIHEGDRLSMAIARAGESGVNSDLNHIEVRRTATDGKVETLNVNLYDVLKSGDMAGDPLMKKDDIVYVPSTNGSKDHISGPASILYSLSNLFLHF